MNIFLESHKNLLENLIKADVEFLIIGGYAVNYYGYNRTTGDLDIWIKPDNSNREKLIQVLESMDYTMHGIKCRINTESEQDYKLFKAVPQAIIWIIHRSGLKPGGSRLCITPALRLG